MHLHWRQKAAGMQEVEWRGVLGGYKKKKLATKLASSGHKYQSSNTTK